MSYRAPLSDISFMLANVVDYKNLSSTSLYEDASLETTSAILNEAAKLAEEVLAPL